MGKIFPLLFSISLLFVSCSGGIKDVSFTDVNNEYSCVYKNSVRKFVLCLPENIEEGKTPLILMLHGLGGNAASFMQDIKFHEAANEKGYGVVFVSSAKSGWDNTESKDGKIEEKFLEELAVYLQKEFKLNRQMVFAGGFSNGAFMCNKLASSKKQKFAAVVSVAGMMPKNVWENRTSKGKTGFLQINGTKDDVVPMKMTGSFKYNPNPAMEDVIEYYARLNNVYEEMSLENISEVSAAVKYGNKVWWIISQDTYHAWPSEEFNHFDVNKIILEFLDGFWNK